MNQQRPPRKPKSPIVCRCNNVDQETIEKAITRGCTTLNRVFDATKAGVGACGGSCRIYIARMLESYAQSGTFPETARPQGQKKKRR
ncbi:MAG: (2Fe-2S)-binding protein [Bdellovibrionaceae bacterium]|nr:(2Fe-2S)-binding protein [Bdellovibrionales bacterium]MCB9084214.1 (2Fe-2S)-binding protein [Pseudobdellovibrionaceae bacterium]